MIFYEMLTGEKPFTGTNPSTIIYKILHEEPVQPQQLNVTLHPAFNEIIGKMLAKDPDKRYQSCSQLIHDLKNYHSLGIRKEEPQATAAAKTRPKSNARHRIVALASVLTVAIVLFGYVYFQQFRQPGLKDTAAIQTLPPQPAKMETEKAPDVSVPDKAEPQKPLDKELIAAAQQIAAPEKQTPGTKNPPPVAVEIARAEIRLEFAGESYPVAVYDGAAALKALSVSNPSVRITAGSHRFRLMSDDVFLDQTLDPVKLNADQVYVIPVPALCSAFIEVTNDAYDGCEIHLDGKTLSAPYPAQIPKLAAGNHRIIFRWNSGKYAGTELASSFAGEANHHYRIRGEPAGEKVLVQQIR